MKQKLLWIPAGETEGYVVPKCAAIELPKEGKPDRLWSLHHDVDCELPPELPFKPRHHRNAFLEDHIHDWNIRDGKLVYSGILGYGGWLLLEYKDE